MSEGGQPFACASPRRSNFTLFLRKRMLCVRYAHVQPRLFWHATSSSYVPRKWWMFGRLLDFVPAANELIQHLMPYASPRIPSVRPSSRSFGVLQAGRWSTLVKIMGLSSQLRLPKRYPRVVQRCPLQKTTKLAKRFPPPPRQRR